MRPRTIATLLACATSLLIPFNAALAFAQPPTESPLHLIPIPRQITQLPDKPLTSGFTVVCSGCDIEAGAETSTDAKSGTKSTPESSDSFAATDLRQTLLGRGLTIGSGVRIVLRRLAEHPDPTFTPEMRPEGYTIAFTDNTLTLTAATSAGLFYAAQTVKQLIERTPSGFVLHPATIHDWPAMKYRGLHDDLSRGPVDTLAFQMKLIRTLAAYKVNLYSPYFENTQQYVSNPLAATPDGSMSADDARTLVAYAAKYHITVIPEQEAFGHLRKMLVWETYSGLAETPHGAVLAPGQAGSIPLIDQMFGELANLYPGPFLHIGGDETVDLGVGLTRADVDARGLATVYLDFLQRIVTSLQPLHRKILFWGDVAQDAPDQLKALPQPIKDQMIAVAWGYSPKPRGFEAELKPYIGAGIQTWVAPSVNNYRQVWPNQQQALEDVQEFTRDGQHYGATGQLNTLWNDDGESLANMNWYGILFGAAAAWQPGESPIAAFQHSYAQAFHGDSAGILNHAQDELTAAMSLLHDAKIGDNTDSVFWVDPWSKDGLQMADKIRPVASAVRLHAETALTLIAQAKAAEPNLRNPGAISAMDFGARRIDFLALNFQLADEMAEGYNHAEATALIPPPRRGQPKPRPSVSAMLSDINGVNGRLQDIIGGYSQLRDMFAQQWELSNRTSGLRPVLEHYDYTIGLWYARTDKVRNAQRQWSDNRTLPSAADLGIPNPPLNQSNTPMATTSSIRQ